MDRGKLGLFVQAIDEKRLALMLSKSQDYATGDSLSNFKRVNQLCRILDIDPRRSPADCARFLMILKVDRWCNLINNKKESEPENESIQDTVLDLHNYIDLAFCCDLETAPESNRRER